MSGSNVLFDAPGPRTIARHRRYTIGSAILVVALLGLVTYRLNDAGQFAYDKWEPLLTPKYINALLEALLTTLSMAGAAIVLAIVFGVIFGIGKLSEHGWVRWPCWAVVEFFRAVPVLLLMVLLFFSFGASRGESGSYWCVVVALMLYNGSVLAEVFRAGILAVPKGQAEAAYALGMRKTQVMASVLLPQAVKIMLPAIISQMVVALKDTSLGYAIAAPGLAKAGEAIYNRFQNPLPTIFVIAMMFIGVNLLLTWLATLVQRKFVGERKVLEVGQTAAV
jgi:glutamate transport system permease protein